MTDATRSPARPSTPAPYLRVDDANAEIAFLLAAFGATEVVRLVEPSGRVAHAEVRMGGDGGATVMLSDEYPEFDILGPRSLGGTTVALQLYVDDVDIAFERAERAGAIIVKPPALDPFGDRAGKLEDPCGHVWLVATRIEEISPAEMTARFDRLMTHDA